MIISSDKFPGTSSRDIIPRSSWIEHYSKIFSKVNYAVHKRFSGLLEKNFPSRLCQRHVIPVEKSAIVKCIKSLKLKSLDIDGISVSNLVPNSFETGNLISNCFFFQMCFSSSCVPDSFLCGSVT